VIEEEQVVLEAADMRPPAEGKKQKKGSQQRGLSASESQMPRSILSHCCSSEAIRLKTEILVSTYSFLSDIQLEWLIISLSPALACAATRDCYRISLALSWQ
jgi:hypothetical protein